MKANEIYNGMPVCINDHKGNPFCNSVVEKFPARSFMPQFALIVGVDDPVHINDLRPFTKGYHEQNPNK